jgi:high frequency lysogenization protein
VSKNWHDLSIALAGIFQATGLVEQLARTGYVPSDYYRCTIETLFQFDPPDTRAVFGDLKDLEFGLKILHDVLQQGNRRHSEALRYALGVLHLQAKLRGRKDMLGVVGSRLQQAAQQARHFSSTHDNVVGNLGDLYGETISTFRFRIQVSGDPGYLQQARIASQVRALLLAGIRSATLWRQVGGNRWQLLFKRRQLLAATDQLLREARQRS